MIEELKIKLFGLQFVVNISDHLLHTIIIRDYKSNADIVKTKLKKVNSDSQAGKNRIAADILKLADKDINELDALIIMANDDSRNIMMRAEYPGCAKIGFNKLNKKEIKQIYLDDLIKYSNWLNKEP